MLLLRAILVSLGIFSLPTLARNFLPRGGTDYQCDREHGIPHDTAAAAAYDFCDRGSNEKNFTFTKVGDVLALALHYKDAIIDVRAECKGKHCINYSLHDANNVNTCAQRVKEIVDACKDLSSQLSMLSSLQ